jgi:hypothetical protein
MLNIINNISRENTNVTKLELEIKTCVTEELFNSGGFIGDTHDTSKILEIVFERIKVSSNTFDILLICNDGKIKTHLILLKQLDIFKNAFAFANKTNDDINTLTFEYDVDDVNIIIDYLYTGKLNKNGHLLNNYFNIVIFVDYVGFQQNENKNLIKLLFSYLCVNFSEIMHVALVKYTFDDLCNVLLVILNIFDRVNMNSNIITYYVQFLINNEKYYDVSTLLKSDLYEKKLKNNSTEFDSFCIIKTLKFSSFNEIINNNNYKKLFAILFEQKPPNMYELIESMYDSTKYTDVDIFLDAPISILQTPLYKKLTFHQQILIIVKYKKYNLLNNFVSLDNHELHTILKIEAVIKTIKSKFAKSLIFAWNNKLCFENNDLLFHIKSIYPFNFYTCSHIGHVKKIINGAILSVINSTMQITINNKIMIKGRSLEITNIYYCDDDGEYEEKFLTCICNFPILCKFKLIGNISNISVNHDIYLISDTY